MDQEDLDRIAKELREWEDKAQCIAEAELVWHTLEEEEAAHIVDSPPHDENDEALDYYDDVDQDTEMASSQGTIPMTSQESHDTAPMSSQETVPMSSQESKSTTPASSQKSTTSETSMPSLETATGTTLLNAAGKAPMDEACLQGPMLKCTLQEERALLNPLLTESLDHLEEVPLGYLSLIEARINEIWRIKVS